jgi:hypothetical protein
MRKLLILSTLLTAGCGNWGLFDVVVTTDQPETFDVNVIRPFAIELIGQMETMAAADLSDLRFELSFVGRGGEHNCYGKTMGQNIVGCQTQYADVIEIAVLAVTYADGRDPQVFWHALAHELGHAIEGHVTGTRKEHRRRKFWAGAAGAHGAPPRNADGTLGLVPQVELWLTHQNFPYTGDNVPAIIYTAGEFGHIDEKSVDNAE